MAVGDEFLTDQQLRRRRLHALRLRLIYLRNALDELEAEEYEDEYPLDSPSWMEPHTSTQYLNRR